MNALSTVNTAITVSSIELVDYINAERKAGEAALRRQQCQRCRLWLGLVAHT